MKKADRQKVFEKYGGKCAYCGCELEKGWHASPLEPISFSIGEEGLMVENEDVSNMMPSCSHCAMSKMALGMNGRKETLAIEKWRDAIEDSFEFLQGFPQYRRALKFGQITEVGKKVVFYFETLQTKTP